MLPPGLALEYRPGQLKISSPYPIAISVVTAILAANPGSTAMELVKLESQRTPELEHF
jgi:hypothetical protein|tara:strand:+ start:301 stop:474 length:174 start_codon:yes stop_codon:yes gene_type:complete